MAYNLKGVLNSETAYKVFRLIFRKDDGSYPKEISREIEAHSSPVSEIVKELREEEILQRGKRTRAQYYEIDQEGLYNFWINELRKSIKTHIENYELKKKQLKRSNKDDIKIRVDLEEKGVLEEHHDSLENFQENMLETIEDKIESLNADLEKFEEGVQRDKYYNFMGYWIDFYTMNYPESTINNALFSDLRSALLYSETDNEYLNVLSSIISIKLDKDLEQLSLIFKEAKKLSLDYKND